ncbi:S9 family peptidase [Sutcliffiella halmapala]|uniref:S9 family peptidase n=1 Tax=Sutcliffiella halmapala TaxID=79882 RepID=UPI0014760E92|nr:S9 family peptidase [Sutcliffiella halmapala]
MDTVKVSKDYASLIEEAVKLEEVQDVQLSPDGSQVAFVTSRVSQRAGHASKHVWIANRNGGAPCKIETSFSLIQEPRWSPDGMCLALLVKEKDCKIAFVNKDGEQLSTLKVPTGANNIEWSPDGRFISFLCCDSKLENDTFVVTSQRKRSTHLYVVDRETNVIHQLSKGNKQITRYAWSPDGKQVVTSSVSENGTNAKQDLTTYHVHNGEEHFLGKSHDMTIKLAWSPCGNYIAWCGREHEPGSGQLVIFSVQEKRHLPRTICADFPGSVKWIDFLPDGRLIFAALSNFRVGIYTTTLSGTEIEVLLDPNDTKQGSLGSGSFTTFNVSLSADGSQFATSCSGPKEPGNVVVGELGKSIKRITAFNLHVQDMELGATEEISWEAEDGLTMYGLLIKPVDYRPGKSYPTVVEIHGGPRRSWWDTCYLTNSWAQLLASQGYMVFLPNPRGSSGRGAKFVQANNGDLGGKDFSDIMSGVDEIIAKGYADPDRLGVAGWSYGGYLTSWAITQTNRFKAAVIGAAIVNWISWNGQSSMAPYWSSVHWREPLIAYQNAEKLIQRSPIHFIEKVQTPTLIFHGDKDGKIPSTQADEFYQGLKALGTPVEYLKYPGEGHGIHQEHHQIDQLERIVKWFTQYL